jgi:hypothetical protein
MKRPEVMLRASFWKRNRPSSSRNGATLLLLEVRSLLMLGNLLVTHRQTHRPRGRLGSHFLRSRLLPRLGWQRRPWTVNVVWKTYVAFSHLAMNEVAHSSNQPSVAGLHPGLGFDSPPLEAVSALSPDDDRGRPPTAPLLVQSRPASAPPIGSLARSTLAALFSSGRFYVRN